MSDKPTLRVECAWCGKLIQEGGAGAQTSHGMCIMCFIRQEHESRPIDKQTRIYIRAYMDYLDMVEDDPTTQFGDNA